MPDFIKTLPLLVALAMATPLAAQETAAPESDAAAETSPAVAPAEPAAPEPYVAEKFDAWELRCVKAEEGADPCQLYQLLNDKSSGKPIMEFSLLALPEGGEAAAGATIIVPLETLLTQQLNLTVDSGSTKRYPFTFCAEVGCVARVGLTAEEIEKFRKGNVATITVVPMADPSRTVDVEVSLKGFTAAFDALSKATAAE